MKCPHNCEIKAKKKFGVIIYVHKDDGEFCDILNSMEYRCRRIGDIELQNRKLSLHDKTCLVLAEHKLMFEFIVSKLTSNDIEEVAETAFLLVKNRLDTRLSVKLSEVFGSTRLVEFFNNTRLIMGLHTNYFTTVEMNSKKMKTLIDLRTAPDQVREIFRNKIIALMKGSE